jgi:hypothetical protein
LYEIDKTEHKNDFTYLTDKKRTDQQIKKYVFQFLPFPFIRFHNQLLKSEFGANSISTAGQSAASWSPIEAQSELFPKKSGMDLSSAGRLIQRSNSRLSVKRLAQGTHFSWKSESGTDE